MRLEDGKFSDSYRWANFRSCNRAGANRLHDYDNVIVVYKIDRGYWGYEMTRLMGVYGDPMIQSMGLAGRIQEQIDFAWNMLIGGPIFATAAYFVGQWIYQGFKEK
ncbi:MAG: hypothetical protein HKN78_01250 [Sphingomonadaceae bacterium]|nr:hypothetical protein [Sphingomonadaceae bacterium]